MEITLTETQITYRLSSAEVETFKHDGVLKQRITIGEEPMVFLLQRTAEPDMRITLHTNLVTLLLPEIEADSWAENSDTPLEVQDGRLRLLVEVL